MPLGIETNNIAPQLIQNSGNALVQGIRQIGQQISGHLTELQTKRDLAAMAQEMQGLNVQSNEFPVQLTQMLARHPLAARDERGQMALSILGKAHGQWQAGEAEARAFNRAMALQTRRDRTARDLYDYKREKELGDPVNVPGVGLVDPDEIDPVTGQAKVLAGAPSRTGSAPKTLSPGSILVDPTGKKLAENPATSRPMSDYQRAQDRRSQRKDQISAINTEINQFDSDIASAEKAYEAAFKREMETENQEEKQKHIATKTELGKVADALKAEKKKRLELLKKLREEDNEVEPELGPVPAGAAAPAGVLPAPGVVAAPASNTEFVAVIDPNGVPGRIRASQLESALANGYRRR